MVSNSKEMKNITSKSNWNEIMAAVRKIESIKCHPLYGKYNFTVTISGSTCNITYARLACVGDPGYYNITGRSKIEAVRKAVQSFVRWYNTVKQ
jgi:hypothetical protein